MNDLVVGILMGVGTLLMVVAGIGVVRMPDALCRGHAVAKAMSLGIGLILLGLWARLGVKTDGLKLVLAIVFQFLTIPVAGHLVARSVYARNRRRGAGGDAGGSKRVGDGGGGDRGRG